MEKNPYCALKQSVKSLVLIGMHLLKDKDSPLKVGNFRNLRISFLCSCSHSKIPSPNFWLASHPMYIALYSVSSVSCRFSNP